MKKRNLLVLSALALSIAVIAMMAGATPALAQEENYTPPWQYYSGCANDNNGDPIPDGNYDMYFSYYDDPNPGQGTKKWGEYHDNVEVKDCYFSEKMGESGGDQALSYKDYAGVYYLEVKICDDDSCNSDGNDPNYETLPRTPLGSAPYSYYAEYAYVGGGWKYHVVVAKDYGNYTSVYDAVQSINDAGPNKPYLVWVGPGIYTETNTIVTKPYVHIMGSGKYVTYIRNSSNEKTVELGRNTSLADLTVENKYSGSNSYAIWVNPTVWDHPDVQPSYLNYVGAYADYNSGGSNNHYAYYANDKDIEIYINYGYHYAKYGQNNYGVYNSGGAHTYIKGGSYYAYEGEYAYGLYNGGDSANKSYLDVYYVMARGEKASNSNYGLYNGKYAEAKLNKGYYYGYYNGAGTNCYGIRNEFGDLYASYIYAYGKGCEYNYGLYNYYENAGDYSDYDNHKSIVELKYGYYGGYYYEGKGDYCYGIYNYHNYNNSGPGDYSVVNTYGTGAYGEDCRKHNWGAWNQNGQIFSYGGYYYGKALTQYEYGSDQHCGGVYNIGNYSGEYNGLYKGYDVTGYGKYCYNNYGIWNGNHGYAGVYGGTYYAHADGSNSKGVNTYAYYNKGANSQAANMKTQQCVGYAKGGSGNDYGHWVDYGTSYIDGCTLEGEYKSLSVQSNGTGYAGTTKLDGDVENSGTIKCVYSYDENYNPLNPSTCVYP